MFTISHVFNIVLSVNPQTQQFITQSLEAVKSFSAVYTPADLQALADHEAKLDATIAKLDLLDSHLQQK